MKVCKCKCGGCSKKGGALSLDNIYNKGGYTFEELKTLWGDHYDSLLDLHYKLNDNLEASKKIILIIISFRELKGIKKLFDYHELNKYQITLADIEKLCNAIVNNIRMEPFFVLILNNVNNLVYSEDFINATLEQNLLHYATYQSYTTNANTDSSSSYIQNSLAVVSSGNNLDFIKNPVNWNKKIKSAHVLLVKDKQILMLTHKPTHKPGTILEPLTETDCRLGPPGGLIDPKDSTPWAAMLREYKEEAGLDFPKNHTLENTFTWCNKYLIFLVTTDAEISDGEVKKNKEIFSRKWFSIDEIKKIIQASNSKQVKGFFKMRNGAGPSTDAIIKFMKY
mgnify:CR=1 FL=1|tara:strand:- start:4167 stop:5177 length:1011 start_codon:yes stop_codon:yes gene_type:complete